MSEFSLHLSNNHVNPEDLDVCFRIWKGIVEKYSNGETVAKKEIDLYSDIIHDTETEVIDWAEDILKFNSKADAKIIFDRELSELNDEN